MIDDQKVVYEEALRLALQAQSGKKQVLIVEGGPGQVSQFSELIFW